MGITRKFWIHSVGMGSWLLLAIFFVGMISCMNDDPTELSTPNADQSGQVGSVLNHETLNWFATISDGTRVSRGDVVPSGSPAILYFFAPG